MRLSLADALADALAEQRHASLERCGITVVKYDGVFSADRDEWFVYRDLDGIEAFDNESDAYTFAYDLAGECIEQGDLTCQ
jgi:hypothetical protein